MGAAHRRHRPGEAPAIAVEHGERPEIARLEVHARLDQLADGVHVRAAGAVHHAFRAARRARGVVDRDRLLLVLEPARDGRRRALGEKILVRIARRARVVHAHDADTGEVERLDELGELGIDEEEARARVAEDIADLVRAEPRIDRHQDAARPGHAVVRLEHRGDVRAQEGDAVVLGEPGGAQGGGEPVHPLLELPVRVAPGAVDHRDLVGKHAGAPLEEADGRELGSIDVLLGHRANLRGSVTGSLGQPRLSLASPRAPCQRAPPRLPDPGLKCTWRKPSGGTPRRKQRRADVEVFAVAADAAPSWA